MEKIPFYGAFFLLIVSTKIAESEGIISPSSFYGQLTHY